MATVYGSTTVTFYLTVCTILSLQSNRVSLNSLSEYVHGRTQSWARLLWSASDRPRHPGAGRFDLPLVMLFPLYPVVRPCARHSGRPPKKFSPGGRQDIRLHVSLVA